MGRRLKTISLVVLLGLLFCAFTPVERYFEIARSLDIFATLFREVNANYVDEIDPEDLVKTGIDGMLNSLDPYTNYIPEKEMESFRISTTGQYGGIGALIGIVNKKVVISEPYTGFPAHKSGLRVGDELLSVNGQSVKGKSTFEISNLLKGQPNTEVEVVIRRAGKKDDSKMKILRERIVLKNVRYHGMIDRSTGYLKLEDFTPGAGKEVANAVIELKKHGATSLVLDLRDNPGGLLHEAVNVVSTFIPKGEEVVSTKGRVEEWNKGYVTLNTPVDTSMPLIILINEGSASASEIVSGALQDHDRAVLVGERTFGKGLVQTTRMMSYNTQLKVTTAKYYIPSGRCVQSLDYSHRAPDGTISRIADSAKVSFQTRNGRIVYDGGGVDPDVLIDQPYPGSITKSLLDGGYIFEYASEYTQQHTVPGDFRNFAISDDEYNRFVKWVEDQRPAFRTLVDESLDELMNASGEELNSTETQAALDKLSVLVNKREHADYDKFRTEIKQMLEQQIAFHFSTNAGLSEYSFGHDIQLAKALELLGDTRAYQMILTVTK